MNFNEFDKKMRKYEQVLDVCVLPETMIVARLDGRGFTKFTKRMGYNKPFDEEFSEMMVNTTTHLMENSGFKIIYGYTQSDEISLLFSKDDTTFNHKTRKINSILAGEASAVASLEAGVPVVFDCRVCLIPNVEIAKDYFLWRQEDANRNALNGWCYWTLRKEGKSKREATSELLNKTVSDKNELLFEYGINYNNVPKWQKRGTGVYFVPTTKFGFDKKKNKMVEVKRKSVYVDETLPINDKYSEMIESIIEDGMFLI